MIFGLDRLGPSFTGMPSPARLCRPRRTPEPSPPHAQRQSQSIDCAARRLGRTDSPWKGEPGTWPHARPVPGDPHVHRPSRVGRVRARHSPSRRNGASSSFGPLVAESRHGSPGVCLGSGAGPTAGGRGCPGSPWTSCVAGSGVRRGPAKLPSPYPRGQARRPSLADLRRDVSRPARGGRGRKTSVRRQ